LFPGVTYLRKDITVPRANVVHVMAIDLQTAKLEFLVTPSPNASNVLCSRVTSKFLEEFKLQVAINGGYYSYVDNTVDTATYCPNGGIPVRVTDYAASRGKIYSPQRTAQPTINIGSRNQVNINKLDGNIFNAISGDRIVVDKGVLVKNLAANAANPRTAVGLSKNARWLTLMVVDGRQPGYSEGVTFPELAELLISYGAHTGVNMDGGGSSTMVIKGFDGKARVLNSPVDMGKPGRERSVANHLGLLVKP
jgi:exopolysaccharide biosynthesis protein